MECRCKLLSRLPVGQRAHSVSGVTHCQRGRSGVQMVNRCNVPSRVCRCCICSLYLASDRYLIFFLKPQMQSYMPQMQRYMPRRCLLRCFCCSCFICNSVGTRGSADCFKYSQIRRTIHNTSLIRSFLAFAAQLLQHGSAETTKDFTI